MLTILCFINAYWFLFFDSVCVESGHGCISSCESLGKVLLIRPPNSEAILIVAFVRWGLQSL